MITTIHRCEVCGVHATRQVLDRPHPETGFRWTMWLCDDCPDPQQVDARAAEVRATWTDLEFYAKAWDCNLANVAYRQQYDLRDHLATEGVIDGR